MSPGCKDRFPPSLTEKPNSFTTSCNQWMESSWYVRMWLSVSLLSFIIIQSFVLVQCLYRMYHTACNTVVVSSLRYIFNGMRVRYCSPHRIEFPLTKKDGWNSTNGGCSRSGKAHVECIARFWILEYCVFLHCSILHHHD